MAGTANSGPRRRPAAIQELAGIQSDRRAQNPTYAAEAPPSPAELSASAAVEWQRVVPILAAARVLTAVDLGVLASYCRIYGLTVDLSARLRALPEGNAKLESQLVRTCAALRPYLTELGLTPASRGKVAPIPETPTAAAQSFSALEAAMSGPRLVHAATTRTD